MYLSNGITPYIEKSRDATGEDAPLAVANKVATITLSAEDNGKYFIVEACAAAPKLVNIVARCDAGKLSVRVPGLRSVAANATAHVAEITEWLEIPCPQESSSEGGEQNYIEVRCNMNNPQEIPTYKSAVRTGFSFAHELESDAADLLRDHEESGKVVAYRYWLPNGEIEFVSSGKVSFTDNPTFAQDAVVTQAYTVSLAAQWNAYSVAE